MVLELITKIFWAIFPKASTDKVCYPAVAHELFYVRRKVTPFPIVACRVRDHEDEQWWVIARGYGNNSYLGKTPVQANGRDVYLFSDTHTNDPDIHFVSANDAIAFWEKNRDMIPATDQEGKVLLEGTEWW